MTKKLYKELEDIVNKSPAVAFLWRNSENWPVEYVTDNIKQFGYEPSVFLSGEIKYAEIIYEDDLERVAAEVAKFSESGVVEFTQEYRIVTKEGKTRWIDDRTWISRNKKGEITHYQGIVMDISDRKFLEEELLKSEENYRLISENANDLISVFDEKFRFEYVNENIHHSLMGYNKEDLIGKSGLTLIHHDDQKIVAEALRDVNNTGIGLAVARIKHKNGQYIWTETKGKSFYDRKGEKKFLLITRDISEREKSRQKLIESEKMFSKAFNNNALSMSISTLKEGRFFRVNDIFIKDLGYTSEEVIGKTSKELNLWVDDHQRQETLRIIEEKGSVLNSDVKFRTKEGDIRDGLFSVSKIIIDNEPHLLSIINDVTDIKLAEKNLRDSEEKFRNIADQSLMGITIIQDGVFKYFNDRITEINGYSRKEIENWAPNEFAKIFHPEDREFVMEQARKKQAGEADVLHQYSYRVIRKDGSIRWIEVHTKTIIYEGAPADLAMTVNITDKIIAKQKLIESEEKYRIAYENENFYKDLFTHDIKNILQGILSSLELYKLEMKSLGIELKNQNVFNEIENQITRGSNLIKNVRKFSEFDKLNVELNSVDLIETVKNSFENIKNSVKEKVINVSYDFFSNISFINANELLNDVIENILLNAIIHNANKNVDLLIRTTRINQNNEKFIKIEFIDNGIGVSNIRKNLIFKRGFNEEKDTTGMGLGLSLVSTILGAYEAKIWVEDKIPGDYSKGSSFVILFPEVKV